LAMNSGRSEVAGGGDSGGIALGRERERECREREKRERERRKKGRAPVHDRASHANQSGMTESRYRL
jgi:hypothetical protein